MDLDKKFVEIVQQLLDNNIGATLEAVVIARLVITCLFIPV